MPDKIITGAFFIAIDRVRAFYVNRPQPDKTAACEIPKNESKPVGNDKATSGRNKGTDRRLGKGKGYKREDLLKVQVWSYVNPVRVETVDPSASWYKEGRILESNSRSAIAFIDGWKVRLDVQVYEFHKIPDKEHQKQRLINHIRRNPQGKYRGWIHHVNYYGGISKKFKQQQILNFHL